MRITEIKVIALRDEASGEAASWNPQAKNNELNSGYDLTLVKVLTDEGVTGIGQCEAPSMVIDAIIHNSMGLESLIVGEDPSEVQRLWQKMYNGTGLYGRRGVTIGAIGAVETALCDIAAKIRGIPVHQLVWKSFTTTATEALPDRLIRPYVTVYPPGDDLVQLTERLHRAISTGASAVKIEEWTGQFGNGDIKKDIAVIKTAREVIGDERDLMIDVQNKWGDVSQALKTIEAIEDYQPYFIEAPLPADNLQGYRKLAESTSIPIAVGDWGFSGRHEFRSLLKDIGIDIVQPSSVRAGGIHEILNIAEEAYTYGALCIPHAWCHMIGVSAELHIAAVSPCTPYIEFPMAFPPSPIIEDLLIPKISLREDGMIDLPNRPGLGFDLNEDVVNEYSVSPY